MLNSEEYHIIVEQAPIMIWRSDTSKACNYFNQTWLDFTGKQLEYEIGDGWAKGVHPQDFDACLKIYTEAFDKREIFEMEYRLKRNDGEYRWIFDRGVPYFDSNNQFQGYIGSCIDIHEAKMARVTLKEYQEKKIHQLQELIPICAWCRKVKSMSDYWSELEEYISKLSGSEITHVICNECRNKTLKGQES